MDPLAAAGPVVTTAGNIYISESNRKSQEKQNEKDRKYATDMYYLRRQHALDDWNMVNAYNHPSQQMERLRQAGLNPNLVYGKGADNTAQSIAQTQYKEESQPAPKQENWVTPSVQAFQAAMMQSAQIKNLQATNDNLSKQNAAIEAETRLKDAQKLFTDASTYKTTRDAAKTDWELSRADELRDMIIEQYKLQNRLTDQTININFDRNEREKAKNSEDIRKSIQERVESQQRILESKSRIELSQTQKLINDQERDRLEILNTILNTQVAYEKTRLDLEEQFKRGQITLNNQLIQKALADTNLSEAQKVKTYWEIGRGSADTIIKAIEALKPKVEVKKK